MKTRQLMGWLTLVGGMLVVLYWSLYFTGAVDLGQADPVVRGFESAFPVADMIFSAVLFSCGWCLLKNRRPGPFLLVVAGAMAVYLGALDTTFYGVRGTYYPVTPEGLFQLFLNLLCVGAGALGLWCGWMLWKGTETPRPARIRGGVIVITGSPCRRAAGGYPDTAITADADDDVEGGNGDAYSSPRRIRRADLISEGAW